MPIDLSEGDINRSEHRARWQAETVGPDARRMLDRDESAYLHQALSTPVSGCWPP